MPIERERKFLVRGDDWRASVSEVTSIRQGYIAPSVGSSVRVRVTKENAFLTIKAGSDPLARLEFEYEIPIADAQVLLEAVCVQPILQKSRHRIQAEGGLVWEVDEFHGHLGGLVLAEIELPASTEPVNLPAWVDEEVTHDSRYLNANLARRTRPEKLP